LYQAVKKKEGVTWFMSVIVFFFAKEIHVIFTTPITFLPVTLMFFVIIYYLLCFLSVYSPVCDLTVKVDTP
jgi:RsiW-degrading membrane proteinase PrsW (M82 family)